MREMKNSGIEWIGDIPSDWEVHRVKSHYSIVSGSGFKPDLQGKLSGDYPVCKASDISSAGKNLFFAANYITVDVANKEGFSVIPYGSIIFAKIGEAMRKNNRSICRVNCCADNNCQGLVPNNIDVDYGYYLFNCIDMKWFDNAGTVPCINNQKLKDCGIPFPNIIEQKKISHFLDEKCAEIDTVIEKTKATIEEYKKLKQSVITQAVTKGIRPNRPMKDSGIEWINKIPAEWNSVNPKALFEQRKEKAKQGERQLTASQQYGVVYQDEYMEMTGSKVVTVEKDFDILKHVESGDFVISMRSFQGGLEYSEKTGSISSAYVMLIPNTKFVYPRFYRWFLKSSMYINALQSTSNMVRDGQAMRYSNFAQVRLYTVPIKEQEEIADYLDKKCAWIDELIAKKTSLLSELESYKKSLIYEYVTGKKEV